MPPHALRVHSCGGHFSPKLEGNLCNYHVPISQMKLPQDLISLMKKTQGPGIRPILPAIPCRVPFLPACLDPTPTAKYKRERGVVW